MHKPVQCSALGFFIITFTFVYHTEDMVVSFWSYVVGGPGQRVPELDREDKPVTLEYQNIVEQQMTEVM